MIALLRREEGLAIGGGVGGHHEISKQIKLRFSESKIKLFKILLNTCKFFGPLIPVLDFWWRLLCVSKPEWAALFTLWQIHLWCNTFTSVYGQYRRKDFCTHGTNDQSYLFYTPIDFSTINGGNVLEINTAFTLVIIEQLKITKITAIWYWSTFTFCISLFFRHFQPLGSL